MLVLTLYPKDFARIYAFSPTGEPVELDIRLNQVGRGKARVAFDCPREFRILRSDVIARSEPPNDQTNPES